MTAPRIENLRVRVTTGTSGHDGPVTIRFNGFDLPLNRITGGTDPGEDYEGEFFVGSVAHSCTLVGPPSGNWDIKDLAVECDLGGGRVTRRSFGAISLDAKGEFDLLADPPATPFDV
jgi:hypothetical protein